MSLDAFSTSTHKPLESNSKQPGSLQDAPFLGAPGIDHFPIVYSNALCSAHVPQCTYSLSVLSFPSARTGPRGVWAFATVSSCFSSALPGLGQTVHIFACPQWS